MKAGLPLVWLVSVLLLGTETGCAPTHTLAGEVPAASEPLHFPVLMQGKVGYIDQSGRIVIDPQFEPLTPGDGVYAPAGGWGIGERYCRWACDFFEGRCVVHRHGRLAYIDTHGRLITPFAFTSASHFNGGVARVEKDEKWGLIDRNGSWITQPRFDRIDRFTGETADAKVNGTRCFLNRQGQVLEYRRSRPYRPPLAVAGVTLVKGGPGKEGMVAADGRSVLEPQFDEIRWLRCKKGGGFNHRFPSSVPRYEYDEMIFPFLGSGLAAAKRDGKWGLVTGAGKVLLAPEFDDIDEVFCEGRCVFKKNDRFGYIDTTGAVVVPPQFEAAGQFVGSIARAVTPRGWAFVTRGGDFVVHPSLNEYQPGQLVVSEGMAIVLCRNNKIGYVDATGRMAIVPRFDAAEPFRHGLARVNLGGRYRIDGEYWHGGKWGYISKAGKWIWEPTN
jgi:hypothetical protein